MLYGIYGEQGFYKYPIWNKYLQYLDAIAEGVRAEVSKTSALGQLARNAVPPLTLLKRKDERRDN